MDEVNAMVAAQESPSDIFSVWVGFLDPQAGRLVWANGGHPPCLLRRDDTGEILRLGTTGPILGATATMKFEEESIAVKPGDMALLYTDGVTEARSGNKFFGEGRVRRALKRGGGPRDVVERLLEALEGYAPGELRDDVAIVAVRLKGGKTPAV